MLPLLTGPVRAARVAGAGRLAAYLDAGSEMLALLAPDAVRVPNGLVLRAGELIARLQVGAKATVGAGAVRAGDVVLGWESVWPPGQPVMADPDLARRRAPGFQAAVSREAGALPRYLEEPVAALATGDLRAAAERLLGLGPGLTPSGDDVLAGFLVTRRSLGVPAGDVTALAARRTSAISADLLRHAAAGRCIPQLADVVTALGSPGRAPQLGALLAVGHHSGGDLARGVALALTATKGNR